MSSKFMIGENEYDLSQLSKDGRKRVATINFVNKKINELTNLNAALKQAKNGYIDVLKREIIAQKAGISFGNE